MAAHRDLAIQVLGGMAAKSKQTDFMARLKLPMPETAVPGALPVMGREEFKAKDLKKPLDVIVLWTIGDFPDGGECSSYYDPASPWYNVFYGAYAMQSYKTNKAAWGYTPSGEPRFEELFALAEADYNFLTAGHLGCPAEKMSFQVKEYHPLADERGWQGADVLAVVPSGLHPAIASVGEPDSYLIYGVPADALLANGREPYEPVDMRGRLYMRRLQGQITLAWGTLCPDTVEGKKLFAQIIELMGRDYFALPL